MLKCATYHDPMSSSQLFSYQLLLGIENICGNTILLFQSPSPKVILLINARQLQKVDLVHFHQTRMSPIIPYPGYTSLQKKHNAWFRNCPLEFEEVAHSGGMGVPELSDAFLLEGGVFKPCPLSEDASTFPSRRPVLKGLTDPEYKYWTTLEVLG